MQRIYDSIGTSGEYLESLYRSWKEDPASVDPEWGDFFDGLNGAAAAPGVADGAAGKTAGGSGMPASPESLMVWKQSRVDSLLWGYRDIGYFYAKLNPLVGTFSPDHNYLHQQEDEQYEQLSIDSFGLSEADLDTVFTAGKAMQPYRMPLRDIIAALRQTYCSFMGIEFLHIQNRKVRRWLIDRIESDRNQPRIEPERKRIILDDLIRAEEFEHFLHSTFVGQKRFSLEGAESLIPGLHFMVDNAPRYGIEHFVIGIAHRGRLTVLHQILEMPAREIFSQFLQNRLPADYGRGGDVKYHIGYNRDHVHPDGSLVHLSMVSNPSHLEAVNPVAEGKTRAIQRRIGDMTERKRAIPILIHGDAAFSGQGVVPETLNLSMLRGYKTGGTIHIIVNNQIGFTTSTKDARSTFFPTDVAKMIQAPIIHVNGDQPESVVHALELALQFREEFHQDVVIDMFCYRRYGHNEGDEPSFTHPKMYSLIEKQPSVATLYGRKCAEDEVASEEDQKTLRAEYRQHLAGDLEAEKQEPSEPPSNAFQGEEWTELSTQYSHGPVETGTEPKTLQRIAETLTRVPEGFHIHPKLLRIVEQKRKMMVEEEKADWAAAESLAFGSLLLEGYPIRLSGEDVARGTFSHRHATWWDVESRKPIHYTPLNNLGSGQAAFSVYDSPLSEFAVLGFEYGYSLSAPDMLVLWEAQFGDFANGAQVIIDNFITSGETKWNRHSGLVMLLPHAYEGQGPDHSSARPERLLQLCGENNIQVCNATTPAQYYHLLRRQMRRDFRKPLFIMTPKSLLRHPLAVSPFGELEQGSFREILDDPKRPEKTTRLLLCSGKIYYDLWNAREQHTSENTAIVRVEQLYPFNRDMMAGILDGYRDAKSVWWVQEEPENQGGWQYMKELFDLDFPDTRIGYIGRRRTASTATGSQRQHVIEQEEILEQAFAREPLAEKKRSNGKMIEIQEYRKTGGRKKA